MWTQLPETEASMAKNLGRASRVCLGAKRPMMASPGGWGKRKSGPTIINSAENSGIDSGRKS